MQRHKAEAVGLWAVDLVPWGWSVELGAEGQRVGAGYGSITTAHSLTHSAGVDRAPMYTRLCRC